MSCKYYQWQSGIFGGDYYCIKEKCIIETDHYKSYCRDWNYDKCPIYNHTESSGCFITTVVCQILGHNDNQPVLNNLRNFRDNVLQKDNQYEEILKEYDFIGPIIADCIINDPDREHLAQAIYSGGLLGINQNIIEGNYDNAVYNYKKLTEYLKVRYKLEKQCAELKANNYGCTNYDQTKGGHGKIRIKVKPNKK